MRIGEWLQTHRRVSSERIGEALALQTAGDTRRLGEILVQAGHAGERDLLDALAAQYHCEVAERIPDAWLDRALSRELPVDFLRGGPMLPVRREGVVYLCTSDPSLAVRHPELSVLLGGDPEPLLAPAEEVRRAIDRCLSLVAAPAEPAVAANPNARAPRDRSREDLLRVSDDAPVAARVSRLLLEGLRQGASDIHLEPRGERMQARLRVDGVLYPLEDIPRDVEDAVISRIKIMAHLDIAERRLPQDGNARVRVGDREVDIRVSVLPVSEGERVVLRLLGREATRLSLGDLGMPEHVIAPFRELIRRPHGVLWVTGPTGSGKTTTLYAALREMDTLRRNILTIEDPVEYQLPDIGQVGVQSRIGLTFAAGLRSLLRQDPDVILVGETRDEETAEIVVRASMTGHLVLSTLHANDAVAASLRLTDMGIAPYLVAEATQGALAQRLVRRLCPHCREKHGDVWRARGCGQCREGFSGRVGLYELLRVNDAVREALRVGESMDAVRALALRDGFRDMASDACDKIAAGVTTEAEVRSVLATRD
jgi:type II secretory ATPase GspE/PulE/Tfp pilus assembly ATPase PilB-like protein